MCLNNSFSLSGIEEESGLIEATLSHGLTVSYRKKVTGFETDRIENVCHKEIKNLDLNSQLSYQWNAHTQACMHTPIHEDDKRSY